MCVVEGDEVMDYRSIEVRSIGVLEEFIHDGPADNDLL